LENYFNTIKGNNGLLIALQNDSLESLLKKAKELEKKYEWLQATKYYKKASSLALKDNNSLGASDLIDRFGFCYYRAALQAKTNKQFKKRMQFSISAFEKIGALLMDNDEYNGKINHAKAMIAWTRSRIESDFTLVADLLDQCFSG
jgi:hypothetical protein